ncbi:HTH-type sugar sensing transcriptional regulator TrmBL1 [uncultured archaeon]|nr:HTH-type sugar sensing transcriptional regulator TrmBL1 [uncultured archaeon]
MQCGDSYMCVFLFEEDTKARFIILADCYIGVDFGFLQELGLTQNEIKIYSALLMLGSAASGRITFETGLHRSRVYEGLNRLVEKGLVSFVKKGNVTYFEATSSEKIVDVLEEEKISLENKITKIRGHIPELNKFRETKPTAEAYILQGVEGFKAMRRDLLKHAKGEHLMIGAIAREDKVLPVFFEKWNSERKRLGIKIRILYKADAKNSPMAKRPYHAESRFLPPHISNPAVINIFGDRVVNVLWKGDYPLCFVMVNKDIADAYRKYFEMLWQVSKKTS